MEGEKGRIEGAGDKENAGVECNDVLGKDEEEERCKTDRMEERKRQRDVLHDGERAD